MNDAIISLDLHRPMSRHQTAGGVSLQNIDLVKKQLLEELVELEKRMKTLESESPSVDYSMIQTYREMIHSRKAFFNELNL